MVPKKQMSRQYVNIIICTTAKFCLDLGIHTNESFGKKKVLHDLQFPAESHVLLLALAT